VRAVAAGRGVALADADAAFDAAAAASSAAIPAPGAELFLDYCHPTLEGMALLADAVRPALIGAMQRAGVALPARVRDRPMLERAPIDEWLARLSLTRARLADGVVRAGQSTLLIHLELPSARGTLDLARKAFDQALRIVPDHAEALQGLLAVELLSGRRDPALALEARLAAAAPDALRKLEEAASEMEPLRAALAGLGLRFEAGRLVAAPARDGG
jgi:hypothetical protein